MNYVLLFRDAMMTRLVDRVYTLYAALHGLDEFEISDTRDECVEAGKRHWGSTVVK